MVHKKVVNSDAGTADIFGGNDLDKWSDFASGVDVDDYDINSDTQYRYDKFQIRNSGNTFGHKHRSLATVARTITYPDADVTVGEGGGLSAGGQISFNGTASQTVFNIPHGLGTTPDFISVQPASPDAFGSFTRTKTSTNIVITYQIPPPLGTSNVRFEWGAADVGVATGGLTASSSTTFTNKTISAESNTLAFLGQPTQTWSIYYSGTTIMARNNKTGLIPYTDTSGNINTVLASIIGSISPAGTPTVIDIGEGDFKLAAAFTAINNTKVGNIKIKGQGAGLTNILLQAGCTHGFLISGSVATALPLTVNTTEALLSVTMTSGNAATFAVGDYVLLRSDKIWAGAATSAAARQGEIHQIRTIVGGVITFHETVMDTYTTADNAALGKISMLRNITLEDLTIRPVSTGYTGQTAALLECKWIDNLQLKKVEVSDSTITSSNNIKILNCINSDLDVICVQSGNYPFVELPTTGQYGIYIGLACQHLRLHVIGKGRWRHVVSGGGINTNIANAGISRDITISGTGDAAMSQVWDLHADADGVVWQNCNVSGAGSVDNSTNLVLGIATRCKNNIITGCNLRMCTYQAITLSELASNTTISGNNIHQTRKLNDGNGGVAIRLNANISGCVITGNTFYDVNQPNFSILADGGSDNTVISGNSFINCGPLRFTDSNDVVINGNRFSNGANKAITMLGTSTRWVITGNSAQGSAASTLVGTNVVANNQNL